MFLLFLILISSYNSAKITEIDQGFDRVAVEYRLPLSMYHSQSIVLFLFLTEVNVGDFTAPSCPTCKRYCLCIFQARDWLSHSQYNTVSALLRRRYHGLLGPQLIHAKYTAT